jgi:Tfp pilus assembly protein PilE
MNRRSTINACALGITLTELLLALAVVALLTTIAIPSYQYQLAKARRVNM